MTRPLLLAAVALGPWSVLAVLACLAAHRARRARPRVAPPEYVRRVDWLPPVPPPVPVYDDWLELLPVEEMTDVEVESRFWRLVAEAS
jgi:hypothetical protein